MCALCYSSIFFLIKPPNLFISCLILTNSLFYGSLFNYYLILSWVSLFPPNIYEIEHNKIEFANVMLLQMFPLINEVINEPIPHYFSFICSLLIAYEECSQSYASHSSIYFGYYEVYCWAGSYAGGSSPFASPMCYYFGFYNTLGNIWMALSIIYAGTSSFLLA